MYTVYILYSKERDRYYIGYTGTSLEIRLKKHHAVQNGFTGSKSDWRVVYSEEYSENAGAISRER